MKILKIYEAGKMSGLSFEEMNIWRLELKVQLQLAAEVSGYKVQVINPVDYYNFEEKKYQSEEEVRDFDLNHVITSDVIVVNLEGLNSSDGTKIELHDAKYHNRIPVIAFGDRKLYDNLHPWVKENITRVEEKVEDVVRYIQEFYMKQGGAINIEVISTSHALAKELLSKPDGFITATLNEEEYVISDTRRVNTHANIDDSVTHWTLNLRDGGKGNLKR